MVPVCTVKLNSRDTLLRCFAARSGALDGVAGEVVVIDNDASRGSAESQPGRMP